MTPRTASRASMYSRHRLRRGEIDPEGEKKRASSMSRSTSRTVSSLPWMPGARRFVAAFGQMAEPEQRLEALEAKFDLPTRAIEV